MIFRVYLFVSLLFRQFDIFLRDFFRNYFCDGFIFFVIFLFFLVIFYFFFRDFFIFLVIFSKEGVQDFFEYFTPVLSLDVS